MCGVGGGGVGSRERSSNLEVCVWGEGVGSRERSSNLEVCV